MKFESEPGTSKIVKTSTGKRGSLVKNFKIVKTSTGTSTGKRGSLVISPQTLFVVGILFSRCPCVRPSVRPSVRKVLFF